MVISVHEQRQLDEVIERLTSRYRTVSPATVSEVVHNLHTAFAGAPLREFVPLFVERRASLALEEHRADGDEVEALKSH